MKSKPRLLVGLHHRGKLSLRGERESHGLGAFHWSLLIVPKTSTGADAHNIDVTDSSLIDAVQHIDLNPDHQWRFRDAEVDPLLLPQLIVMGCIGKLDGQEASETARKILADEPVPRGRKEFPAENCASWAKRGWERLQQQGLVPAMDVEVLAQRLIDEAMRRLDSGELALENVINLTGRPCEISFRRDWNR